MDGPSVYWKFFNSVTKKREEEELPALINIGSFGLHVIKKKQTLWPLFMDGVQLPQD